MVPTRGPTSVAGTTAAEPHRSMGRCSVAPRPLWPAVTRNRAMIARPLASWTNATESHSVSLVVRLDDVGCDTTAVTDRVTVGARPLANVGSTVCTPGTARSATRATPGGSCPTTGPTRRSNERSQRLTQLGGVLLGQIDLVRSAVQSEPNSLISLVSIEIVNQRHDGLLRHATLLQVSEPRNSRD